MKMNLAKSAGFCFGVKRAINLALETARANHNVYMLGDIVHNEDVVNSIKNAGIKKINRLGQGKNKILLIRAHGAPLAVHAKAKKSGYKIIDATCPMVEEIHKIGRNIERQGRVVIIIGDKNHDEVRGIVGHLNKKALIIDDAKNICPASLKRIKKAGVVSQSTQNLEKVLKIVAKLKEQITDLKFFNTICQPTKKRQEDIKRMPLENDAMVIIGSKNSANTKRLYEIARSLNRRSYWINSRDELDPAWFKNAKSVGITSGASTPDETTQDVIRYLSRF